MARSRNPNKRKTRIWSEISGTTLSTLPSGVTIDNSGIITAAGTVSPTELSYLDGAAGDVVAYTSAPGYVIVSGTTIWKGTTIQLSHGLTTLTSLIATYHTATQATAVSAHAHIIRSAGGDTNGTVSAVVTRMTAAAMTPEIALGGGSVSWIAFGA
uniref:Uncharacterized protein n=1 Tax=viral metagenome TaxID=1070528 RepID=A0A6M3JTR4_9ZZZZ